MFVTSSPTTAMSRLLATWRRQRHLLIALMTCALVLTAYLLWTSTDGHVAGRGLNDFRQSPADWRSHRATGDRVLHARRHLLRPPDPVANGDVNTVNRTLRDSNSEVHARNPTVLLGDMLRQMSVVDDNFQANSFAPRRPAIQRVRLGEEHGVTRPTRQEHIDRIPAAAAEHTVSTHKNSSIESRRKLEGSDYVSVRNSSGRAGARPPRVDVISSNIPYSSARRNPATPEPLYLVVSNDEKDTESVEVFREPEVVIRTEDADKPFLMNRRVSGNASDVGREYGPGGGKRSPLLGALRGGPGNCRIYKTGDELPELVDFAAGVDCVELKTTPTVVVCPYPDADDRHLSRPLRTHGVWEPHIVRVFQAALLTDNELGVFDVGANVGQYALLAAAMGHRVVAVELHRPNIYRLHKAIRLGRLEDKV